MNKFKVSIVIAAIIFVTGCSSIAPQYQPDFNTVNDLKDKNLQATKAGKFTDGASVNNVTIRAGAMTSPYNESYGAYLKYALEENLKQSGHWDKNSSLVISGELIKNELDASGFSVGLADLTAKFVVTKSNKVVYDKTHTIHHEWESSFLGAVAIPNARNNYPVAVQKLLNTLFADKELLAVLKK